MMGRVCNVEALGVLRLPMVKERSRYIIINRKPSVVAEGFYYFTGDGISSSTDPVRS